MLRVEWNLSFNLTLFKHVHSFYISSRANKRWHPLYPTGRSRLETVAVLGAACIMATATVLVIRESIDAMVSGFAGVRG